jgi:hypothetical protein
MWGPPTVRKPVSFADILAIGGVATVKRCSADGLIIPYTYGRPDALVADDTMLPSPDSIIEDRHNAVFQQMVSTLWGCAAALVGSAGGTYVFAL